MAIKYTYKQLEDIMESFADSHLGIRRFFSTVEEQIPPLSMEDDEFPVLFMTPVSVTLGDLEIVQTIKLTVYDRLEKDRTNYNDIVSDTQQILNDCRMWLGPDNDNFIEVIATSDPVAIPLNNKLLDFCFGWSMDIGVKMEGIAFCFIPLDPAITPIPPDPCGGGVVCLDGDVTNSNGSFNDTVASGGLLTLDDIDVTIGGAPATTHPAAIDITFPVAIIYDRPDWGGQSTVYDTGDIGTQLAAGVYDYTPTGNTLQMVDLNTSFVKLIQFNTFGNKDRFTDDLGTQVYLSGVTIDHVTGLMWKLTVESATNFAQAQVNAAAKVFAGHSDWRTATINESLSIADYSITTGGIDYAPFNLNPSGQPYYTNETTPVTTTNGWTIYYNFGSAAVTVNINKNAKTVGRPFLIVRTHLS